MKKFFIALSIFLASCDSHKEEVDFDEYFGQLTPNNFVDSNLKTSFSKMIDELGELPVDTNFNGTIIRLLVKRIRKDLQHEISEGSIES